MQINSQIASILFQVPIDKFKGEKHTLNRTQCLEVENALALVPLLKLIEVVKQQQSERQLTPISKMDQMKQLNTPSAKLYNWNIVIEVLGILDVKHQIEGDIKQHVLMGDYEVIDEIINQIYTEYLLLFSMKRSHMRSNTSEIKKPSSRDSRVSSKPQQRLRNSNTHVESLPSLNDVSALSINQSYVGVQKKQNNRQVDLMNVSKEPIQAHSALELFISSLSKNLQISSKQAATLFADNNKYLAHVLAKGVQGIFEPVLNYLNEIINLSNNLVKLLDEKSLVFCLQAIKPGFVSKSNEVSLLSCKLMIKLQQELQQLRSISMIEDCYKWLVEKGGFQTTLLGINRHPDNTYYFTSLLIEFSKMHLLELFTVIIRSHISHEGDRIAFLDTIIVVLGEKKQIHDDLISLGIVNDWFELCFKSKNQLKNDFKICAARLLSSIWKYFITFVDDNDERGSRILKYFTELIQLKIITVSLFVANLMFQLLELFTLMKHKAAPVFYKTIILIFIENYDNQELRYFFLQNFENTIQACPNIPISLLIEPLVKQLQQVNPCGPIIKFFGTLSEHKGLTIRSMIQILDTMAKLSLYDIPHYNGAAELICKVLGRGLFIEDAQPTMIEFAIKYVKVALNVYFRSMKQKKDSVQSSSKISSYTPQQTIDAQKRGQIIKILRQIALFQNEELNQKIKFLVSQTEQQCRDIFRLPNKGTMAILAVFGKPEDVFNSIKKEMISADMDQVGDSMVHSGLRQKSLGTKKPNMNKLTKEEQYYLASLRIPKNVDPKVVAELKEVKDNYQNKIQQQQEDNKTNEVAIQKQKQLLRKQLEKRSIEQGVATKNMHDVEANLLYQDGSREKEIIGEKKNGLPIMEIVDLAEEEDRDRLMIDVVLQQSGKVLRWIFTKYANSGFQVYQAQSFDQLKQQNSSITIAEIRKFLQDYELDTKITKEEVIQLAREVHVKLLYQRNELKTFEFNSFQTFFVQLCINLSTRHPFNQKNIPPYLAVQQVLKYMREITASKKQSTQLYDDPDAQYFSQSDIIKEYNKQLTIDPNFILPEGFKKVSQPNLTFSFNFSEQLHVKKSKLIAYQVIDELIGNLFGVHMIEPITLKSTIYKAQPSTFGYINSKINNGIRPPIDQLTLDKEKIMRQSPLIKQKRRVLEIEPKRELSLTMKLELNKFSIKDRFVAEQVANVLDDIFHAVEFDKTHIDKDVIIQNKAIEQKKLQDIQKQQIEKEREDKRKKRQQEVKESLLELKKSQLEKVQNEKKRKIEEDLLKEQENKLKKQKRNEYLNQIKEKVKENKIQIKKEVSQHEGDIKKQKMDELEKKKKEFMQFNKEKIKEFQQELKDEKILNKLDKKAQEQKQAEKIQRMERLREEYREMDARRIKFEKETSQKINQQFNSPLYQGILKKNEAQLQGLFDFLIKETFYPIGKPASRSHITLRTFTWFTDKFKITPEILSLQDVVTIFRSLTRDKPIIDRIPVGMDINEFYQGLHRLSIKGKSIFNNIANKIKSKEGVTINEMDQIIEDAQFENDQLLEDDEQLFFNNYQQKADEENQKSFNKEEINDQQKKIEQNSSEQNKQPQKSIRNEDIQKQEKNEKYQVHDPSLEQPKGQSQQGNEKNGKKQIDDPNFNSKDQSKEQTQRVNDSNQEQKNQNQKNEDEGVNNSFIKPKKVSSKVKTESINSPLKEEDLVNSRINQSFEQQSYRIRSSSRQKKNPNIKSDLQQTLDGEQSKQITDVFKRKVAPRSVVKMNGERNKKTKEEQKMQYLVQILSNLIHKNQYYFFYGFEPKNNKLQKKNQELQLIDNYGNVDEANQDTLNALIVYLNLSEDKNQMEMRFRQILEEGKVPTKLRKQGLKSIIDSPKISKL